MRRTTVAVTTALVVVATLTAVFIVGRDSDDPPSAAAEPSPGTEEVPPTPEPPSAQPVPPPEPIEPDDSWDGPAGTMTRTGSDSVALTFDDGPSPAWTPKVLNTLADWGVKATFCVVGKEARAYPDLVRDIVDGGHTLCNHSWNHELDLGRQSVKKIRANLDRTNRAIRDAVPDVDISYYRQPGGQWTKRVVKVALEQGMVPVHWTVDPSDWDKSVKAGHIEKEVRGATKAGSIVLMHDGGGDRRSTSSALKPILSDLTSRFELIALPPR